MKMPTKLKKLKSEKHRLESEQKRIEKRLWELDSLIWDIEVKAVKPTQMCRRQYRGTDCCALRKGHKGTCQGVAPPLPEPKPKHRKVKYKTYPPRGASFVNTDLSDSVPCKNCGWPVSSYNPPYQSADHGRITWFHDMGDWGEMPKGCDDAAPDYDAKAATA